MAVLSPPDFDSKPVFTSGRRWAGDAGAEWAWVGYGIYMEFPSACFWVIDWGEDQEDAWFPPESN